jgi:hypothetical protein
LALACLKLGLCLLSVMGCDVCVSVALAVVRERLPMPEMGGRGGWTGERGV